MIDKEDLEIFDSSLGMTQGQQYSFEVTRIDKNKLIGIRDEILENQEIIERLKELRYTKKQLTRDELIDELLKILGDKK